MTRTANDLRLGLLRQPGTVLFGPGQRHQLARMLPAWGGRALFCTDERMAGDPIYRELVAEVEEAGTKVTTYSRVQPDLPRQDLEAVARTHDAAEFDVVVAIGGGSVLDFAKVAAVLLARGGDVAALYGENVVPGPGLPLVTVPTTGGTGAEATCISVVYDDARGMKVGIASPWLEAVATVVDPELTLSCPPGLTTATAADALTHLVEAFTARAKNPGPAEIEAHLYVGKNLLTDTWARQGLRLVRDAFPRLAADPADLGARSDTMLAAFSAGMAINTAGTAAAHALQSPIGALTHTAHGIGVGALLPYVMRFNLPTRVEEFAEVAELLGVVPRGGSAEAAARAGITAVEDLLATIGCPPDLAALGLRPEHVDQVADQALLATRLTANNPRELDREDAVRILERGLAGDRSWWS
ncbi:iron-containing alcohol dehydrogenase [Nocardioides humi]|uniref:Iron-containing alcohol dehydrogenase n=1 Tax=Nocardioides humi TaxID=449461 RepID=A0ABN2A7T0_9ACTN|nr:iron-containing alcohol dehydrogenase [Nocardioides humi]